MLMAARQLVVQKGKAWVEAHALQTREQEQCQTRSMKPEQKPVQDSDKPIHTPSTRRLAAKTAASARSQEPQSVQSRGSKAKRSREAHRSESSENSPALLGADSSIEGSSSSEVDEQPLSPVASIAEAAKQDGVQQDKGHDETITQRKNGKKGGLGEAIWQ
ncbi:hypothetical protein NDU88_002005 [Pleurodeles waltl]|uniref:Uncharacterized protein n=1 Tax=Pleurodeles waltl TaxID=8319 RepID=A0AAV7VYF4_PLEWA|nr:hypothetical protein NDU88_002005 [Pleurodeles waltl]